MKYYFYYAVSIIVTLLIITCVSVQDLQTPIQSLFPSDDVLRGTTANGTTYYVYETFDTGSNLDVVNFVLLVNAGSVYEDDNQLGLAHFVEHMAFNGTTNFPGNTIVSELEKRNIRFGADLNAYTDFDHTVFFINIPNNEENIDLALDVLKEWAYNLSYEEDEIEKEKPVVLEEVRSYQETRYKIFLENLKFILRDSKYAERDPGGKMDVIETAPRDVIKKFYDDWYVPDLMAVYVGGNVDAIEIEEKIRARFSNTDKRKEITPVHFPIPLGEPDTMVVRKVEDATQDNTVRLNYIMPIKKIYTLDDVINDSLLHISAEVINKHLSNISVTEDAVVSAGSDLSYFISEYQAFDVSFQVPEDTYSEGMEIIFNVLATLKNTELDEEFIATVVNQFMGSVMGEASYDFDSIFHDYRQTYPLFDMKKYRDIFSEELRQRATPQAIKESINTLMSQSDLRLIVSASREGLIPNDEDIQTLFTTTLIADNIATDLVDHTMDIRTIEEIEEDIARAIDTDSLNKAKVSQSSHPDYEGVYYFETPNGFTVEYQREILYGDITMVIYGPGGTLYYTNQDSMSDYVVRTFMESLLSGLTVADLSVVDFDTYKEQHGISTLLSVDGVYQSITIASNSVDDLDTMFKMPYLYFTASSFDSNIAHNIVANINSQIQNIFNNADAYFLENFFNTYLYGEDPYYQGYFKNMRTYTVTNKEVERAIEVYNAMIATPQNFRIIIYGDVPPSKIRRYVKKYIASIPRNSVPSIQAYHPMRKMDFSVTEQFEGMEQSKVFLGWGNEIGPQTIDYKDMVLVAFLEKLLTIQLSDVIREQEGGVYSIDSFLSYVPVPILPYDESDARSIKTTLSVQFASEPSKAEELRDKSVKVLEQLRDNPIDEALIDRAFAAVKRTIDEREYSYWWRNYYFDVYVLTNFYRAGGGDVLLDVLSEITPDDIQEFLRNFMDDADFFTYTLEPKMEF